MEKTFNNSFHKRKINIKTVLKKIDYLICFVFIIFIKQLKMSDSYRARSEDDLQTDS
jgi:hypothetical protein